MGDHHVVAGRQRAQLRRPVTGVEQVGDHHDEAPPAREVTHPAQRARQRRRAAGGAGPAVQAGEQGEHTVALGRGRDDPRLVGVEDDGATRLPARAVMNPKAATTASARSRFSWWAVP